MNNEELLEQIGSVIDQKLEPIKSEVTGIKSEVTGIKSEVTGIKSEVAGIKSEVAGIKSEVAGIKSEVAGIKSEVTGIKSEVTGIKQEQKKQGRTLNRVQKDIKLILKYHDENVIALRTRIERLEEHTRIPPPTRTNPPH